MNVERKIPLGTLSFEQYAALEKQIPGATTTVTSATTELQAGYQLGVQAVLATLRNGFVVGGQQ